VLRFGASLRFYQRASSSHIWLTEERREGGKCFGGVFSGAIESFPKSFQYFITSSGARRFLFLLLLILGSSVYNENLS
jgi:hypothetical protein